MVIKEKVTVCKMCYKGNLFNNSPEYLNLIGQSPHSVVSYRLILALSMAMLYISLFIQITETDVTFMSLVLHRPHTPLFQHLHCVLYIVTESLRNYRGKMKTQNNVS